MTIRHAGTPIRMTSLLLGLAVSGCASVAPPEKPFARGTLGIEPGDITRELRRVQALPDELLGAVVAVSFPGGPAERAGLRTGDVLLRIGSSLITNSCEAIDALFGVRTSPVPVEVRRDGAVFVSTIAPVAEMPFLERACRDGAADACFRVAWLVWSGSGVEKDEPKALELYGSACDKGSAEACAFLGLHLMEREAPAATTVEILARSCDLGSSAGCAHLAYLYATGTLVPQDDARATPLYVRSCELGDGRGCYNVGLMYREGRGAPVDLRRAIAAYDEGCRGGSSTACTDLGWHYGNGVGVAKDEARAVELYRRGCNGTSCQPPNRLGCVNLGRAYRDGIGVEKDSPRAARLFESACEDPAVDEDVHVHESQPRACSLLGAMALVGDGVERDTGRGLELSVRGCDGRDAFGCFNAAAIWANGLGVEADLEKASGYYQLACDFDDAESCNALALLYDGGKGVARDLPRARLLFEKACAGGFEKACDREERTR